MANMNANINITEYNEKVAKLMEIASDLHLSGYVASKNIFDLLQPGKNSKIMQQIGHTFKTIEMWTQVIFSIVQEIDKENRIYLDRLARATDEDVSLKGMMSDMEDAFGGGF